MQNFSQRLLELEAQFPDKQILHFQKTGEEDRHLTYSGLMTTARRVASALEEKGVRPGEVVVLVLHQSIELLEAYFGVILNGSIPSIMPFLTEKLLPEKYRKDLESLFKISLPSAIITYNDFSSELQLLRKKNAGVSTMLFVEEFGNSIDLGANQALAGLDRKPHEIALLQHSSGSTGLQKGVALSHQAVFNQLTSYLDALHIQQRDVIVSWLPLYHDMGLIANFLMPMLYNIPLVLMSPFDWVRAPYRLFKAISDYQGTLCWLPNFAYNFCAQKVREDDMRGLNLSSLRAVINCSEPMRQSSHQAFLERFAPYGVRANTLATCYAMAENVFAVSQGGIDKRVTYDEIDLEKFQREKIAVKALPDQKTSVMVSAGKPVAGTSVKIIDQENQPLGERRVGEIAIKSNCMLNEYFHRPDATAEAVEDGWFKTGDLGYLSGGELYVSGRKKDLIIVGGKNVYPQDIENVVSDVEGVHPGRAVAFGVFNEEKGTEDMVVIAELEAGKQVQTLKIAENIRKAVNQNSAVALRHVMLVDDFWLIKTSSGKIARSANKEKYLAESALPS